MTYAMSLSARRDEGKGDGEGKGKGSLKGKAYYDQLCEFAKSWPKHCVTLTARYLRLLFSKDVDVDEGFNNI